MSTFAGMPVLAWHVRGSEGESGGEGGKGSEQRKTSVCVCVQSMQNNSNPASSEAMWGWVVRLTPLRLSPLHPPYLVREVPAIWEHQPGTRGQCLQRAKAKEPHVASVHLKSPPNIQARASAPLHAAQLVPHARARACTRTRTRTHARTPGRSAYLRGVTAACLNAGSYLPATARPGACAHHPAEHSLYPGHHLSPFPPP
jgi:hypothetical protein